MLPFNFRDLQWTSVLSGGKSIDDPTNLSMAHTHTHAHSLILRSHQYKSYAAYSSLGPGDGQPHGQPSMRSQFSSLQPTSMVVEQEEQVVPAKVYPRQCVVHKLDNVSLNFFLVSDGSKVRGVSTHAHTHTGQSDSWPRRLLLPRPQLLPKRCGHPWLWWF